MDGLPTNIRINAISYASPRVGNKAYQDAFTALEDSGKLRHVRVSNEGDVVAVAPSIGFRQTGLNLHVSPDGMMDINYLNNRSFFSQINLGAAKMHGLNSYHERMFRDENKAILDMSVDQLYENFVSSDTCTSK